MPVKWNGDALLVRAREAKFLAVAAGAIVVQRKIRSLLNQKASNRGNGGKPSAPGESPAKNTGSLARSIAISADGTATPDGKTLGSLSASDGSRIFTRIGSVLKYARIHELGGIITAKKSKYLTIPVSKKAKIAAGRGQTAREAFGDTISFVPRANGGLLIEQKGKGNRAKTIVHYVLKKSITMPKRPYIRPGFAQSKEECAMKMMDTIKRVMRSK